MIKLLESLRNELFSHLSLAAPVNVVIGNIGLAEITADKALQDSVVITLINTEVNNTLRKGPWINTQIADKNNTANALTGFNLYLLFSCNYSVQNYMIALTRLFDVIHFFQSKNVFSLASHVNSHTDDDREIEVKFSLDPVTLTFEEIHHMWGTLGVRQMPFVLYKLRIAAVPGEELL
ncbi:hypothetical protein BH20BAC1_BH20BAC1_06520 [soil metagenome]